MLATIRKRFGPCQPYLLALIVYLISRGLVVVASEFAVRLIPLQNPSFSLAGPYWYHRLLRWDSGWYRGIAEHGYSYNGNPEVQQNVAFFPLYPMISRLISTALHIPTYDALFLVANVSSVAAVVLLFKLVREEFGDDVAFPTIALLSFFPSSVFLSAGYTEGLALLLIVVFFLLLKREHYVLAAVVAGFACATRTTGIVLLPVLLWDLWRKFGDDLGRLIGYAPVCLVLATSGLWLYMLYLWSAFGDPLAFSHAQMAWHGSDGFVSRLIKALTLEPIFHVRRTGFSPRALDYWFFIVFMVLALYCWRRLSATLGVFAVGVLLLPYLTLAGGRSGFTGMARYCILAFPAFIAFADLCRGRLWLALTTVGMFGGLLFMYSAMFTRWYWLD